MATLIVGYCERTAGLFRFSLMCDSLISGDNTENNAYTGLRMAYASFGWTYRFISSFLHFFRRTFRVIADKPTLNTVNSFEADWFLHIFHWKLIISNKLILNVLQHVWSFLILDAHRHAIGNVDYDGGTIMLLVVIGSVVAVMLQAGLNSCISC